MIKKILGFDISSTCIGYCLLEFDDLTNDVKFIKCNYHKPTKKGNILERLYDTKNVIKKVIDEFKPDFIAIEDIIQFMKNKSSAKTVITLAVFNRMIGLLAYDYLGKSPELFNVMQIRHGLKLSAALPQKAEMPELVANHLKIAFPYVYKKKGNIDSVSEDMADSVAVALYCAYVHTGKIILKIKKPKIKKSKKGKKE